MVMRRRRHAIAASYSLRHRPDDRRRVLLVRLLVICLAIAATVTAVEFFLPEPEQLRAGIWFKLRGSIEEHQPGRLRPKAGFVGEQAIGGGVQRIRHNALGMRGPEIEPKAATERRALFVGDSMTYGLGVQEEETFAFKLAPLLTAAIGTKVTTGIAACPGFGIRDQVDLLRRARTEFQPDLIVSCVFVDNDLYDDIQLERGVFAGYPLFLAPHVHLLRRSWRARLAIHFKTVFALEHILLRHAPSLAMDTDVAAMTAEEVALWHGVALDQSVLFLEQAEPTPATLRLMQRSRDALAALQREADATPLVVVVIPSCVQYVPGVFEYLAAQRPQEKAHVRGTIQGQLRAMCDDLRLPVLDLLPPLLARTNVLAMLIPGDWHLTPHGHDIAAEVLLPWLATQLRP